MPAAPIWFLAKARRETGPPFSARTPRRRHGRSSANALLFCCELLPCFAFLMPQESDESKPHQGRRRRREKEEQANAPEGEQEEANEKRRKQATSQQQQVAAAEGRSSNSTSRQQRRAGAFCSKPERGGERGGSKTAAMGRICFALPLASSLRSKMAQNGAIWAKMCFFSPPSLGLLSSDGPSYISQ